MRKIIAFYSPYPRAGKTTAAVLLLQKYGFKLLSFANPISVCVSRVIEKTEIIKNPSQNFVIDDLRF